jgi:hypothetical protein
MSTYIVSPSTSVVLIDTSILTAGASAIVLLSSSTLPGRNVTIRDSLGYLSSPQSIIVSTTSGISFADGTSSIQLAYPFANISFSSRDTTSWNIINTFGFPLYDTTANVNSLTTSTLTTQNMYIHETLSTQTIIGSTLYLTGISRTLGPSYMSSFVVGSQSDPEIPGYSAYILGSSYISSNIVIGGNLLVDGVSEFQSSVTINGSATISGGVSVGGNLYLQGNFNTTGAGEFTAGELNFQSSATILGPAVFNSNVQINSSLNVVGHTTLTSLDSSTLQISSLRFYAGGSLQGRTDIVPGQVVAAWTNPIYTPYLSTQQIETSGYTRTGVLQVHDTISAPTLTQFLMSSASIVNRGGNLAISSIYANTITLSNALITSTIETSSLYTSSIIAYNNILCTTPTGLISAATITASTFTGGNVSTGSLTANTIYTPSLSVSSLNVSHEIIGGPYFTTLALPSTSIQNNAGSIQTSTLYTNALTASTLTIASGLIQTSTPINIVAPSIYMSAVTISSLNTSSLNVSSLLAGQITIGTSPSNLGPTLVPVSSSNVAVTGGPGSYLSPYFLSNVIPVGQNPAIAYSTLVNYTASYSNILPPGLTIGYSATLFWEGEVNSYVNIGNGDSVLYGSYGANQTATGVLTSSTFQIEGGLYGNSALSINFGYQYSPNVNSIDPNSLIEFNNGILNWKYALNGTTIQNSLNDISTRNLFYYGSMQFASDPRLKENIIDADLKKCYDTIISMPLRRYKYIDSYCSTFQVKDSSRLGFLATDLLPHFPKSVHTSHTLYPEFSTSLLTIDTSQVEMAHLGATKYLIEEVKQLEAMLANLLK